MINQDDLISDVMAIIDEKQRINIEEAKDLIYKFYDVFEKDLDNEDQLINIECVVSLGNLLKYLFEKEVFNSEDVITLNLEFVEICMRNYENYTENIYVTILNKINDILAQKNCSKLIVTIVNLYKIQFGYMSERYLNHAIVTAKDEGLDARDLNDEYNINLKQKLMFKEDEYINAFMNFYNSLSESDLSNYFDDIQDILDTYVDINEMISNVSRLKTYKDIKAVSKEEYKLCFIKNYILDYSPALIEYYKKLGREDMIHELNDIINK